MSRRLHAGLAGFLLGLATLAPAAGADTEPRIPVQIGSETVQAEVAADPASRRRGLMHRQSLPSGRGMLFVWPRAAVRAFWMKNTQIPLSVAFLDASGRILNIHRMVPNNAERRYRSRGQARFALEVPRFWFRRHGIRPGDWVRFCLSTQRSPTGSALHTRGDCTD